jgi:hypothetical protein
MGLSLMKDIRITFRDTNNMMVCELESEQKHVQAYNVILKYLHLCVYMY